jgi:hypothetical protein
MVDPAISNLAGEKRPGVCMELRVHSIRTHILEVLEAVILGNKVWIKGFKQDAAGNMQGDQVAEPRSAASGCPSHHDAFLQIRIWIHVETAAHDLNGTPVEFTDPEVSPFQWISCLRMYRRLPHSKK